MGSYAFCLYLKGDIMEIRVLRYFIAVANHGNISAAANDLHLSQPTLSRQVRDLEQELRTDLFVRGNRKITLTDEGRFLLKKAREIVGLVDKTEANFKETKEIVSGDIYIGGGETEGMQFIAKTLKGLLDDYPNIRFHLHIVNADEFNRMLYRCLLAF